MTLIELLTIRQFCERYSISHTQTYREVNAGRLRLTKLGTASRVSRKDAEAWAQSLPVIERAAA